MQQLKIEHKNTIKRDRRFSKGMVVAVSCEIVAIDDQQKGTYKIQSETDVNKYYIVKFIEGTPVYCSCKDFEIQSQKNNNHICKHQRAIVLAENYGLITKQKQKQQQSSYRDDDYSF